MGQTIACLVAHADDESLGPGATLAKFAREGDHVFVGTLADGVTARYDDVELAAGKADDALARRRAHFKRACDTLGVAILSESGLYRDQRLDEYPFLQLVKHLEAWVLEIQPSLVLTHSRSDLNLDHRIVHDAVLTCRRAMPGSIYGFRTISSVSRTPFRPTLFYRVEETLGIKAEAIACYEDEVNASPSRTSDHVMLDATRWVDHCGHWHVEAFEVIREVR